MDLVALSICCAWYQESMTPKIDTRSTIEFPLPASVSNLEPKFYNWDVKLGFAGAVFSYNSYL